jgi:hypothetical protein
MNNMFCYHLHKYDWFDINILANNIHIEMDLLANIIDQSNANVIQVNEKKLIQVEYLLQAMENYFYHN